MSAPWIQTYTGHRFYPLDPRVEDVDIHDIAHALSNRCRYGGHTLGFYSVAQHSVLVARQARPEDALAALLHDAHEAYSPFGDVPRPVKRCGAFECIVEVEERIDRAIAARFGLLLPIASAAVKELDARILADERYHLMAATAEDWGLLEPLGIEILPWTPGEAEQRFLEDFDIYRSWNRSLNCEVAA